MTTNRTATLNENPAEGKLYESSWIFLSLLLLRVDKFRNFTINYVFAFPLLNL